MTKERTSESSFIEWPAVEGALVGQLVAAAVVLGLILNVFFREQGIRNLAHNLRATVETNNDEKRDSKNFNTRRRALNMDKLEEIYDHIVDAKRDNTHSNVFNKIDVQNTN